MSVVVLFLAVGFLLIAVLLLSFLRRRTGDRVSTDLPEVDEEAGFSSVDTPRQPLTERLFGLEDWKFVESQDSDRIKHVFLQQRRDLAMAWMEILRRRTKRLMDLHRASARTSPQLQPLVELRVTMQYLLFRILWQFVALAIWLRGPLGMRGLIQSVDSLSGDLRQTIGHLFPGLLTAPDPRPVSSLPE
jgi:hypothetical protein